MLLNAADIVQRTATLLDDPTQAQFDDGYIRPFLNQAWNDLANRIAALGIDYEEVVAVITPVAANTADLSAYQAVGQVLESMIVPVFVEWKRIGEDDIQYQEAKETRRLPDVPPGTQGIQAWEWRGGKVVLTASTIDVTLRIRFKAFSADFVDPTDKSIVGIGNVLAYKAVELICAPTVRNNVEGMKWAAAKGLEAIEDFEVLIVKQKQKIPIRFGSINGRQRRSTRTILLAN